MAFKLLIICVLIVATAKANFFDNFPNQFPGFQMPTMPPMPPMPQITFPTFPPFPTMPPMPSFEEMAEKSKTDPNTNFNSVEVKSSSKTVIDKDGKVVKTGGTYVRSNNNGVVNEVSFGDKPSSSKKNSSKETPKDKSKTEPTKDKPETKTPKSEPKAETPKDKPEAETLKVKPKTKTSKDKVKKETTKGQPKVTSKKSKIPKVKYLTISLPKAPEFEPIDLQNHNTVSSFMSTGIGNGGGFRSVFSNSFGGGSFKSVSSSSSSSFSNINGVKSGGGIASTHYNVDGDSGGETVFFSTS